MGPRPNEISSPRSNQLGGYGVSVKLCFARGHSALDSGKSICSGHGCHGVPKCSGTPLCRCKPMLFTPSCVGQTKERPLLLLHCTSVRILLATTISQGRVISGEYKQPSDELSKQDATQVTLAPGVLHGSRGVQPGSIKPYGELGSWFQKEGNGARNALLRNAINGL